MDISGGSWTHRICNWKRGTVKVLYNYETVEYSGQMQPGIHTVQQTLHRHPCFSIWPIQNCVWLAAECAFSQYPPVVSLLLGIQAITGPSQQANCNTSWRFQLLSYDIISFASWNYPAHTNGLKVYGITPKLGLSIIVQRLLLMQCFAVLQNLLSVSFCLQRLARDSSLAQVPNPWSVIIKQWCIQYSRCRVLMIMHSIRFRPNNECSPLSKQDIAYFITSICTL